MLYGLDHRLNRNSELLRAAKDVPMYLIYRSCMRYCGGDYKYVKQIIEYQNSPAL